jgi:hypothetical protein
MTRAERDAQRLERRRRGEPTLPLSWELDGLTEDEAAAMIGAAAAIEAAWWRNRSSGERDTARRQLLVQRTRAEAVREGAGRITAAKSAKAATCPWCGRACAPYSPACLEHDELERGLLQAAGDGWG